jgi:hypothetical protein
VAAPHHRGRRVRPGPEKAPSSPSDSSSTPSRSRTRPADLARLPERLRAAPGCRHGAGKPHGFGAVTVTIDWPATELRTGDNLLGCWLSLDVPTRPPLGHPNPGRRRRRGRHLEPVLAPAIVAWREVANGTDKPIHYPRTQERPEAETYRWFVENERVTGNSAKYGIALPHVLEDDQRLPHLPAGPGND